MMYSLANCRGAAPVPKLIHVEAYRAMLPVRKVATVHGTRIELEPRLYGNATNFEAVLDVYGDNGVAEMGQLILSHKGELSPTIWAVVWKIGGKGVAKLDIERADKLLFPSSLESSGKLSKRKGQVIRAFVPHWVLLDTLTGEYTHEHYTDESSFPANMPMDQAVPKWCREVLHIELQPPSPAMYMRTKESKLEKVGTKSLFQK